MVMVEFGGGVKFGGGGRVACAWIENRGRHVGRVVRDI